MIAKAAMLGSVMGQISRRSSLGVVALAAAAAFLLSGGSAGAGATWAVQMSLDGPTTAVQDTPYTYSLTFTNPGAPTTVFFSTAESPSSPEIIDAASPSSGSCSVTSSTALCSLGTLATGASARIDVTVTPKTTGPVPHDLVAVPDASGGTSTEINYYTVIVTAPGAPRLTDLRATFSSPASVPMDMPARFTLTVSNVDSQTALNLTLFGQLDDASVIYFEGAASAAGPCVKDTVYSPFRISCSVGDLAPGQSVTATMDLCNESPQSPIMVDAGIRETVAGTVIERGSISRSSTQVTQTTGGQCPSHPATGGGGGGSGGGSGGGGGGQAPPRPTFASTTLPPAIVGKPYKAQIQLVSGVPPFTFAWNHAGDPIPPGLTLTPSGLITGVPAKVGTSASSVIVSDSGGSGGPVLVGTITIRVDDAPIILRTRLPRATVGKPFSARLAEGGTAPFHYQFLRGRLPRGLTLTVNGVLTGRPRVSGTFRPIIQVTDAVEGVARATLRIDIAPSRRKPRA